MLAELEAVRKKRLLVDRLRQERRAMEPSLSSPKLSGMPRSVPERSARLERDMDTKRDMDALIADTEKALRQAEKAARREMGRLTPELYTFCLYYFLDARPVREVCRIIDRDPRTFYRYKRELRAYDAKLSG